MVDKSHKPPVLPSAEDIVDFIRELGEPISKRELCQAFGIKGNIRANFKALLREMVIRGDITFDKRHYSIPDFPHVVSVEIIDVDENGDLLARAIDHPIETPIRLLEKKISKNGPRLGVGDKVLVRLREEEGEMRTAVVIRFIRKEGEKVYGFIRQNGKSFHLLATTRQHKAPIPLQSDQTVRYKVGDFVVGEVIQTKEHHRSAHVFSIQNILGHEEDAKIVSLIAICQHALPQHFSVEALKIARNAKLPPVQGREDLRNIPFVTIDGEDARDFDDAVWAEPDTDPKNQGGWHMMVAIADVAYYVRENSPLDHDALTRGNSTYFPDRVIPMLPEELSNGLCSLKPDEDRGCLAVHLWIDKGGLLKQFKFVRGIMRSVARLTYTQVQQAIDDKKMCKLPKDVTEKILPPLVGAFHALLKGREKRSTLDFDREEPKVQVNEEGVPYAVTVQPRYDSHRLIEEFMILANVAAAIALEEKQKPCLYRVHEPPEPTKVDELRESLKGLGISFAKGQTIQTSTFKAILDKVKNLPIHHLVNELVLRTQSRAHYHPDNGGHFGLNLQRYAHFTSPIRRYADLVVHRSLIKNLKLGGDGGLENDNKEHLVETAEHISVRERVSEKAERETVERYVSLFLSQHVDTVFQGRIDGVTTAGLFVELEKMGATGLLPMRFLTDDFYQLDAPAHTLWGRRHGRKFTLGDEIEVTLAEADPLTGSLTFTLPRKKGDMPVRRPKGGYRKKR